MGYYSILLWFKPQTDDTDTKLYVLDVAAGVDEKISLLVEEAGAEEWREVQVFNKTADLEHKFPVRSGHSRWYDDRLTVTSGKQGNSAEDDSAGHSAGVAER